MEAVTLVLLIWTVDSLQKLLPDAAPPEAPAARIELACAQNEFEAGQIAIRAGSEVKELRVRASDLKRTGGEGAIPAEHVACNFVGFIPIEHNTYYTPDEELLCKAPGEIPDVLLADEKIALPADRTQTIWVSVYVPKETPAGRYTGTIEVEADGEVTPVPIEVQVFDFAVPDERHLYVTNWFSTGNIVGPVGAEPESEEFFMMLRVYADNMASHRQNVFWIPWRLIKVTREPDGSLAFDYSKFDRYVETFLDAGVDGRIEIQATAHRGKGGWESRDVIPMTVQATDRATGEAATLSAEEGLGPLLAALEKHLEERGWLERAMIHISDEPYLRNLESWREASAFVHRYAPRIKRIEAIESRRFDGALEVWAPKLSHLRNWYSYYDEARKQGSEMWYYICCHPPGVYMNRFLDYALIKTRLLHWVNYRYDLPGYLHWGFNFWVGDPFGPPPEGLPPGDRNIVYPGPEDNPYSLLNSIRWEVQRDSIEDFEYMWLLEQRNREVIEGLGEAAKGFDPRARSRELCGKLVRTFTDYEKAPARFQEVRATLGREIESALEEPLVLLESAPSEDSYVAPAPTVIEFDGVTRPGARVVADGSDVEVAEDGTFQFRVFSWKDAHTARVTVETDQGTKELVRVFEGRVQT